MITAVVTSDNHLGVYYARLRPERLEQRRKRLQQAFARVVDAAIAQNVDLFLHAGDLFDRPDPRNADRVFVAQQVRRLRDAGITLCAIAGNHDSPRSLGYDGGILPHEEMDALGAIRLFRATDAFDAQLFTIRGQRVRVRGMSSDFNQPPAACPLQGINPAQLSPQEQEAEERSEAAENRPSGCDIDLVLLHYGVEGWAREDALEPCLTLENLDRLRAHAICVGHLHTRNQKRLPGGALLLNPGATEHIHFGEENLDCGFWLLHCESGHVEAEYVPTTPQPMQTLQINVNEALDAIDKAEEQEDQEEQRVQREQKERDTLPPLMRCLVARMEAASHPDQLLRVRLTGRISHSHHQEIDLNLLQTRGQAANFHCQFDTEPLIVCDEFADVTFGYGVSFEVETELQNTAREMMTLHGDNPHRQDILAQAGRDIAAAYARLR